MSRPFLIAGILVSLFGLSALSPVRANDATTKPTTPGQQPQVIKHKTSIYKIVSVQGKVIYSISFEADDSAFSHNLSTVKRITDSLAWVPVDANAKP